MTLFFMKMIFKIDFETRISNKNKKKWNLISAKLFSTELYLKSCFQKNTITMPRD